MAYNGRRMGAGRRSRRSDEAVMARTMGRVLLFPVLLIYLELVLHIHMKTALVYFPVYLVFSVAAGLFFAALTLPWTPVVNGVLVRVLAVVVSLVFVVEMIAKTILQTYYGPSSLGTAANNRLTDYSDVIISTVLQKLPIILIMLLPAILVCVLGGGLMGFERFDIRFAGLMLGGCVVFHVLGLGVTHLPWKGDLTPAGLYKVPAEGRFGRRFRRYRHPEPRLLQHWRGPGWLPGCGPRPGDRHLPQRDGRGPGRPGGEQLQR